MKKRGFLVLSLALVFAMTLAFTNVVAAQSYGSDVSKQLSEVRQVTTQYHDIEKAIKDGYGIEKYHVVPNMGVHFVKEDLVGDGILDPLTPEVLVYEPRKNGGFKLVAVEYLTVGGERPSLFGQEFDKGPFDGSFALHAWIWQANPMGMFTPFNPKVAKTE